MSKDISLKKIGCSNCGAELLFDPGTQMSNCNFCGSSFEITNANDEAIIVPDGILPFSVTTDEYNKKVLEWLSEGDYTPDDILGGSQFSSSNGLYLPMFFFTGKYSGNWSASSGYERREYYTEWSETQKKRVQKSRTVTDWRPSSGSVAGSYAILSYAGNSENIDETIAVYAHGTSFKRGEMKPYDIKFTQGFSLLEYKKDENEAWDKYGFSQLELKTQLDAKKRVPGDKYKDFYCDVSKSDDNSIRVYVPFWITYYDYNNKKYHVHMDGSSISRIEGKKPVDEDRKKEVNKKFIKGHVALVVSVVAFCFVVFSDLSENEQSEYWPFIIGLFVISVILYGIGIYQKNKIISESKQRRKKILKRIQEGKGMIPIESVSASSDIKEVTQTEANKENESKTLPKKQSSFSKKYLWFLILAVVLVLAFLFREELGISKNNISTLNDDKTTINEVEFDAHNHDHIQISEDEQEEINSLVSFKIKIKDKKKYINVRKSPVNGSVINQVSEKERYTVTNVYKTDEPLYLLNKKMTLEDVNNGIKIEKPKNFKLNNVIIFDEDTYLAELVNTDETINKVYIKISDVSISYNEWYFLEEINGWIFSAFCDRLY